MKDRGLWTMIAAAALFATLVLWFGFALVLNDMFVPASSQPVRSRMSDSDSGKPASLEQAGDIRIVALGDSLTKGSGDSTGKGYVLRVRDGLKQRSAKPVSLLNNLAVNGMRADQLGDRLANDPGYQYAVKRANLILFSIGGNDLFLSTRARLGDRKLKAVSLEELTSDFEEAMERFRVVVKQLNALNPTATIVYMGLYNPFFDLEELRAASLNMQEWNKEAYQTIHAYPNMLMVPTFDLFEGRISDYLSADHFHPSNLGYERIASRMLESLK